LSDEEALRERISLEQMVKGLTKRKEVTRIGETGNFIVDYDSDQKIVFLYEKNSATECPFKLAFSKDEIDSIASLLFKARTFIGAV
jgi:hypothetical protein